MAHCQATAPLPKRLRSELEVMSVCLTPRPPKKKTNYPKSSKLPYSCSEPQQRPAVKEQELTGQLAKKGWKQVKQEQSWVCLPVTEDHVYSGWYDPGYLVFYHLTMGARMPSEPHPSHPPSYHPSPTPHPQRKVHPGLAPRSLSPVPPHMG